ncbi:hypothetical protein D9611_004187 [Ephemerocybe angulata]|uniref:Carboxymuconolactone decarboxylase-like domain-containing protein n=1 Tax=Ephemerocybe angulata TaxID=980116 RepID=A0A8H5BJX4_9AGAR|nr:hypothetical protein D9611_004187 [Tulosesus angulatus]
MSTTITTAFLNQLKSFYPASRLASGGTNSSAISNPWYIVTAVALSASNKPDGVPRVFEHMLSQELKDHASDSQEDRLILARKFREAIFKSGLISGYPKAINSLVALHEAMPEDLRDTQIHRSTTMSLAEYEQKGQVFWDSVYGANDIYEMLYKVYPDLAWFSKTIGYGFTYGPMQDAFPGGLSQLETSYTLVAALIAGDTPQQIAWHLAGAKRCGASSEEVQAVRSIAIEVAKHCGIQWKNPVPEIDL